MAVEQALLALVGAADTGAYQINQSLRFNSADSANLSKSFTASASCTFSFWVKRANLGGAEQYLFWCDGGAGNHWGLRYDGDDKFTIFKTQSGADTATTSTAVYRDASGWYHIVVNGTPTFYVNGVQVATGSYTWAHIGGTAYIGRRSSTYLNAYLAEFNYIDGSNLTPSSFGETDTITGAWIPKAYSGSRGTNGFYLKFQSSGIGTDSSGNGNNWTANNFSTSGTGTDVMSDTPTNNWCTLNPLNQDSAFTLSDGNLRLTSTANTSSVGVTSTSAVSSGKWYWEVTRDSWNINCGISLITTTSPRSSAVTGSGGQGVSYLGTNIYKDGSSVQSGLSNMTDGDIAGIALDLDSNTVQFYRNGSALGTAVSISAGTWTPSFGMDTGGYGANVTTTFNFGQRGAFAYTPPTGFKALNTANLPEPTIKKGSKYFDVLTWSGTGGGSGATRSLTGLGFSPDFVWGKIRSSSSPGHILMDSVRGVGTGKYLQSNTSNAEGTSGPNEALYGYLSSLDSAGFTVTNGTSTFDNWNKSGDTYVAWCWDESATPGFDIVTYTGTGSNRTVNHSLGVTPSWIIVRNRTTGGSWWNYHASLGTSQFLRWDDSGTGSTSSTIFNAAPTSTVFSVGTSNDVNKSGDNILAYCFSEVAGFSKFGSYVGNGSTTDGPFIWCGFTPRFILIKWYKDVSTAESWHIYDTARQTYNATNTILQPDSAGIEETPADRYIDILSNGFKLRQNGQQINRSGASYIFAAFASTPFKYSTAR